jgi:Domain of unknown function (DUF929)
MNKAERAKRNEVILVYASMVISVIALAAASFALAAPRTVYVTNTIFVRGNGTNVTVTPLVGYNISSALIAPSVSLSDAPVITQLKPPGNTLYGINAPLNASELGVINNAPNSYFQTAGNMLLNGTLNNSVGIKTTKVPLFVVNGKPSVLYVGSITCIWCAANRWSMALALSRFGNFTYLFKGYSSLNDGDAPTLYWAPMHYESTSITFGSFYNSNYVNFLPIEEAAPITGGFSLQPLSAIQQNVNQTGNLAYRDEVRYIIALNSFGGTPYTVWGNYVAAGADARAFGNSSQSMSLLNMTHQQLLQQIARPSSQLGWTEYAGADYYAAMICKSINNTAPVCGLPAIRTIESALGS